MRQRRIRCLAGMLAPLLALQAITTAAARPCVFMNPGAAAESAAAPANMTDMAGMADMPMPHGDADSHSHDDCGNEPVVPPCQFDAACTVVMDVPPGTSVETAPSLSHVDTAIASALRSRLSAPDLPPPKA